MPAAAVIARCVARTRPRPRARAPTRFMKMMMLVSTSPADQYEARSSSVGIPHGGQAFFFDRFCTTVASSRWMFCQCLPDQAMARMPTTTSAVRAWLRATNRRQGGDDGGERRVAGRQRQPGARWRGRRGPRGHSRAIGTPAAVATPRLYEFGKTGKRWPKNTARATDHPPCRRARHWGQRRRPSSRASPSVRALPLVVAQLLVAPGLPEP